jgi:hypothetical protein
MVRNFTPQKTGDSTMMFSPESQLISTYQLTPGRTYKNLGKVKENQTR